MDDDQAWNGLLSGAAPVLADARDGKRHKFFTEVYQRSMDLLAPFWKQRQQPEVETFEQVLQALNADPLEVEDAAELKLHIPHAIDDFARRPGGIAALKTTIAQWFSTAKTTLDLQIATAAVFNWNSRFMSWILAMSMARAIEECRERGLIPEDGAEKLHQVPEQLLLWSLGEISGRARYDKTKWILKSPANPGYPRGYLVTAARFVPSMEDSAGGVARYLVLAISQDDARSSSKADTQEALDEVRSWLIELAMRCPINA